MKKLAIGSIVGGILIFIWQTLSWTMFDLHRAGQEYTPKQDSIMSYLNSQFAEDGSYLLPSFPKGTSREEMEKQMKGSAGKPWMQIQYHKAMNVNMGANIFRGLIIDIIMVALLCWILMRIHPASFAKIFIACFLTGVIVFINSPYTIHIWYGKADIDAHLADALVSWSLCGTWLGWWLNRRAAA
ncbi:MAG: hypothetical protein P4L51_15885 [Puia sp.]|nr:hypothetical protein [Puia sp.]